MHRLAVQQLVQLAPAGERLAPQLGAGQIGIVFSTVGCKVAWGTLDSARRVKKGQSEADLEALYKRRNGIAHEADWRGGRKRNIEIKLVRAFLANAKSIVESLEAQLVASP